MFLNVLNFDFFNTWTILQFLVFNTCPYDT